MRASAGSLRLRRLRSHLEPPLRKRTRRASSRTAHGRRDGSPIRRIASPATPTRSRSGSSCSAIRECRAREPSPARHAISRARIHRRPAARPGWHRRSQHDQRRQRAPAALVRLGWRRRQPVGTKPAADARRQRNGRRPRARRRARPRRRRVASAVPGQFGAAPPPTTKRSPSTSPRRSRPTRRRW